MAKIIILQTCDDCPFINGLRCRKWGLWLCPGDDGLVDIPDDCKFEELGREMEMDFGSWLHPDDEVI